ncbi:MAG: D-alanine--D-alanine ligase [Elusimicrobia bacterium RIFOXYB2_FULL_49_7]|nr:MAG: D-alanine--D-alanine ligase [Elusimicrobia bacterium RIFOXYB2_FULL_49_7]
MKKNGSPTKPKEPGGSCRSLGPVPNLEEHVQPDWWRRIFNSIYLKTDADVVDDQLITRSEVELFSTVLSFSHDAPLLDLCCGQGRHCLEMARRGFVNLRGLDRSHFLIQRAKLTAKKEGLPVKFREGDARKIPFAPEKFDGVMILGNSFGYFETIQDDVRVLKEVLRVLKPWGKLLIDVAEGNYLRENFQSRSWEWIDKKLFVCRERSLSLDKQRIISREVVTHVDKGVLADQFYAERLYTRESMNELLKAAGFSDLRFHAQINTDSQRNQDLGMMERRLVLTAVAKKAARPARRKGNETRQVAVMMGDPKKSDVCKPAHIFDEDDFHTIDQLKRALHDIPGYEFNFLSNHDTFFMDLKALKGRVDFVFNLCDEGYNNDARKELHVPALLEMLGIPYTGGGPQCLAFCYDKSLVRGIAKEMGIPVPRGFFIKPGDSTFELPFAFPMIVKPNAGDSSFGITQRSMVNTVEELSNAIAEVREKCGYDKPVLVEEFLTGKDLTIGIIGNPPENYQVLPIIEEDYSDLPLELPRLCGYEAKWLPDSPYSKLKSVPAELPDETEKVMEECSLRLFERLECRDYVRFDWRLDGEGNPRLLEVNPNPGWCWDGHLAKMSKIEGISYRGMLSAILKAAERRMQAQGALMRKEEEGKAFVVQA